MMFAENSTAYLQSRIHKGGRGWRWQKSFFYLEIQKFLVFDVEMAENFAGEEIGLAADEQLVINLQSRSLNFSFGW